MWGFALKLTVGDGLVLLRSKTLYDTIGVASTDLGTQIQVERALTAGVLSSGQTTSAGLTAQQAKTTAAADKFKKAADDEATRDVMSDELVAPLESLLSSLERLPSIREGVSLARSDRLTAITAYNAIMDDLFALYERLVSVPDLATFQQASAMQGMGNAHEMITREDALVRGALASGTMTADEQNAFSEWVATRRFLYGKNRPVLSGEMRAPYEQVLTSPLFDRFTALENQIVNQVRSGGPLPADAEKWSPTIDQLILRLDSARVKASDALSVSATSVATGIMLRILVAGGLGLVVIIATIVFSVRFGRRLARDLAGLRDAALELADVRLPQVVEKLRRGEDVNVEAEAPPIKATGSNEVEDVAHAFSSVQRTAVEAAVGQAALRRGVSQVFLNLARRKQTLLHRQLTLLDTMQRRAEDPEGLEDLFRLDHLTTRMRRHAESLIILSGSAPGRSWRKPVPLIDVVRAAISEVEDYTRVSMAPMPNAAIVGATVADVVHLIAELLENATVFSPPQTKVAVRGEVVANGLAVEIEDRGLGLTPEEYDEINARLADPPEFDLADSDRLGLFVVGQLAARHEIGVVLRGSPYGGTTAIVLIPRTLMMEEGSPAALAGPAPRGAHAKPALAAGGNDTDISLSDTLQADLGLGGPAPAGELREVRTLAGELARDVPGDVPGGVPEGVPGEFPWETEDQEERTGASEPSPFFTPAAQRTEAVPSAARDDLSSRSLGSGFENPRPSAAPSASPSAAPSASPSLAPPVPPSSEPATATAGVSPNGLAQRTSKQRARGPVANGTHAGLPRRVRQANIAPQLRAQSQETAPQTPPLSAPTVEERSPEEARAMFSAFQRGALRGREDSDQPGGAAPGDHVHNMHGEKGDE
ncbi:nitrate- and nitrite sensing domain-containing protein [Microbispora sp. NBRC 16548]|uniref:nitrate- and nitrite sensing domain-containing protein n=1 Tax=Microbispora sp. NBRC 16548 TaxID=3030994 RepID=UPI0024A1636F|nr:nitrate- and nitrite sensing domain-containing protein [Microbispora sp. NBRC 16548]GLX05535.1 histidine kinase [Microbispora sp. NBRC 16548]